MKISFQEVAALEEPVEMIVYSLDQALYQVMVVVAGSECLLTENSGKTFRRHALSQVREALQVLPLAKLTLRQQSAYDEMIGQPARQTDNTLEVPLSLAQYPPVVRH